VPAHRHALTARRSALLGWYRASRRDLPWRRTRDPYAIWISEAMLQQTRVETVVPYWERFLARFPTVRDLAEAPADAVLGAWAGLGYYSRARNLQRAAREIVERFGGALPEEPEALESLPGIGRYTAGAVASIAFDRPAPVVDGNVARVLARLCGIREDVGAAAGKRRLWQAAEELVAGEAPGDLNQALMELGATLCLPRAPRCEACPVARRCEARAAGDAETLPVKARKRAPRAVEGVAALVLRAGKALAVRRPPSGLLGGLWDLPGAELAPGEDPQVGIERALAAGVGLRVSRARRIGAVDHVFTHRVLQLHVFRADAGTGRVRRVGFDAHRWVLPEALARLPHGALTGKALAVLGMGSRCSR
jgi:A/G-specific adenine glycosylase